MEYTYDIHAERLQKLLLKKDPCSRCPATRNYAGSGSPSELWDNMNMSVCEICWSFIDTVPSSYIYCPCSFLGSDKAITCSWNALKEKGYLDG